MSKIYTVFFDPENQPDNLTKNIASVWLGMLVSFDDEHGCHVALGEPGGEAMIIPLSTKSKATVSRFPDDTPKRVCWGYLKKFDIHTVLTAEQESTAIIVRIATLDLLKTLPDDTIAWVAVGKNAPKGFPPYEVQPGQMVAKQIAWLTNNGPDGTPWADGLLLLPDGCGVYVYPGSDQDNGFVVYRLGNTIKCGTWVQYCDDPEASRTQGADGETEPVQTDAATEPAASERSGEPAGTKSAELLNPM